MRAGERQCVAFSVNGELGLGRRFPGEATGHRRTGDSGVEMSVLAVDIRATRGCLDDWKEDELRIHGWDADKRKRPSFREISKA